MLKEKDTLRAITLTPLKLVGMSHRMASLEEGKAADIIILDGNSFDYGPYIEYTIIDCKLLYDKNKPP